MFSFDKSNKEELSLQKMKIKGIGEYRGHLRVTPPNAPFGVFGLPTLLG